MSNVIAVLDACVLYPASVRDILLRAAQQDLYRPQWSAQILDEVTRNLRDKRGLTDEQAQHLLAALREHFAEAEVAGYDDLLPVLTCHQKDRHVLAAAIHAQAQVIVTFNLKDFPTNSLAPYNVEAQHPDDFLVHLYNLGPEVIIQILREQAAALKKSVTTLDRVLETLAQHAPVFVSNVRHYVRDMEP